MFRSIILQFFLVLCFLFSGFYLSAEQQLLQKEWRQGIIDDIDAIHHAYEASYAPVNWKQAHLGCDFSQEVLQAKKRVMELKEPSQKDSHEILRQLMSSLKDYHVRIVFFSTESAELPFEVKESQGRYFFSYIDNEYMKSDPSFPFSVGDELLTMNDESVDQIIIELQKRTEKNNPKTDKAYACLHLTKRSGSKGDRVPQGQVKLVGRKAGTNNYVTANIEWDYTPERINGFASGGSASDTVMDKRQRESSESGLKSAQAVRGAHSRVHGKRVRDKMGQEVKYQSRRSFLPYLGDVKWESKDTDLFHAYMCVLPSGKVVGYVRIPTFDPEDPDVYAKAFAKLMARMERKTDMLVIDQHDNDGGLFLYTYGILSALTDKPLKVPQHRIMLTHKVVASAWSGIMFFDGIEDDLMAQEKIGKTDGGYRVTKKYADDMVKFYTSLIQEWAEGRKLTNPLPHFGFQQIEPNVKRYTKPILVLINELDMSCADFFPAILQDNKRALLLGTRTAGAGGFVIPVEFPNFSGIRSLYFTGSIAEREGATPIENLGVVPNIEYQITPDDLEFGYKGYTGKIIETVNVMLKPEAAP